MNDEQIKHMVNKFLGWKLPEDFSPDAGISYNPTDIQKSHPVHRPVGTNLFTATQAEAMVRHMLGDELESFIDRTVAERLEAELKNFDKDYRKYCPVKLYQDGQACDTSDVRLAVSKITIEKRIAELRTAAQQQSKEETEE